MLVYSNNISLSGPEAHFLTFKTVGVWLKEQLGFGLHPEQLRHNGEFSGRKGDAKSWLKIYVSAEEEPEFFVWLLTTNDEKVAGRQWVTEIGAKIFADAIEVSCTLETREVSALVAESVTPSRPRFIRYIIQNAKQYPNVQFLASVIGRSVKTVGLDEASYNGLLAEIQRPDRDYPIILTSSQDDQYLIDPVRLQEDLFGLAQVVQTHQKYNSFEMEAALGRKWSAWDGATNLIYVPTPSGFIRNRLFLSETVTSWGTTQHERMTVLLAWTTNITNLLMQRKRIRPELVTQTSLRRQFQKIQLDSSKNDTFQLHAQIEKLSELAMTQAQWISTLEEDNSNTNRELSDTKAKLIESDDVLRQRKYENSLLKEQLKNVGNNYASTFDTERFIALLCESSPPSPLQCLDIVESLYGSHCIVLPSAKESAEDMDLFTQGRTLLDLLIQLVTKYRDEMIQAGDVKARQVFGKNEYAAKESETVMSNRIMRNCRTFMYKEEATEMFRHLKIGVDDDITKTIRVHFHWDSELKIIVIGYCGKHFPVASH